jgi:hypothetical protein
VPFGKQFRVPRCKLEDYLGGPITWPPLPYGTADTNAVTPITAPDPVPLNARQGRSLTEQTVLHFPA